MLKGKKKKDLLHIFSHLFTNWKFKEMGNELKNEICLFLYITFILFVSTKVGDCFYSEVILGFFLLYVYLGDMIAKTVQAL